MATGASNIASMMLTSADFLGGAESMDARIPASTAIRKGKGASDGPAGALPIIMLRAYQIWTRFSGGK